MEYFFNTILRLFIKEIWDSLPFVKKYRQKDKDKNKGFQEPMDYGLFESEMVTFYKDMPICKEINSFRAMRFYLDKNIIPDYEGLLHQKDISFFLYNYCALDLKERKGSKNILIDLKDKVKSSKINLTVDNGQDGCILIKIYLTFVINYKTRPLDKKNIWDILLFLDIYDNYFFKIIIKYINNIYLIKGDLSSIYIITNHIYPQYIYKCLVSRRITIGETRSLIIQLNASYNNQNKEYLKGLISIKNKLILFFDYNVFTKIQSEYKSYQNHIDYEPRYEIYIILLYINILIYNHTVEKILFLNKSFYSRSLRLKIRSSLTENENKKIDLLINSFDLKV